MLDKFRFTLILLINPYSTMELKFELTQSARTFMLDKYRFVPFHPQN